MMHGHTNLKFTVKILGLENEIRKSLESHSTQITFVAQSTVLDCLELRTFVLTAFRVGYNPHVVFPYLEVPEAFSIFRKIRRVGASGGEHPDTCHREGETPALLLQFDSNRVLQRLRSYVFRHGECF